MIPTTQIAAQYQQQGFVCLEKFLSLQELTLLRAVTARFHQRWLERNQQFYQQRAINSAYLTHIEAMSPADRLALLQFIGSQKMSKRTAITR